MISPILPFCHHTYTAAVDRHFLWNIVSTHIPGTYIFLRYGFAFSKVFASRFVIPLFFLFDRYDTLTTFQDRLRPYFISSSVWYRSDHITSLYHSHVTAVSLLFFFPTFFSSFFSHHHPRTQDEFLEFFNLRLEDKFTDFLQTEGWRKLPPDHGCGGHQDESEYDSSGGGDGAGGEGAGGGGGGESAEALAVKVDGQMVSLLRLTPTRFTYIIAHCQNLKKSWGVYVHIV